MAQDIGLAKNYTTVLDGVVNSGATVIFSVYVRQTIVQLYDAASLDDVRNGTAKYVTTFSYKPVPAGAQDALWNFEAGLPLTNGAVLVATTGGAGLVTYSPGKPAG